MISLKQQTTVPKKIKKSKQAEQAAVLDDIFQDMYKHRHRIYKQNFIRGLFFGAGSTLGGTILLAFVAYILSWFIDLSGAGQLFDSLKR